MLLLTGKQEQPSEGYCCLPVSKPNDCSGDCACPNCESNREREIERALVRARVGVLLVPDDVWQAKHTEAFDALGPSGRVLITTRDHESLTGLGAVSLDLVLLPPEDALNLMTKWAGVLRLWQSADLPDYRGRKLLRRFANRALLSLVNEGGEPTVRFHDLQGDYLRLVAKDLPGMHARLVAAYEQSLPGGERESARWAQLSASESYLWRHLFHHLLAAGQRETIENLVGPNHRRR